MGISQSAAKFLAGTRIADASGGDLDALFELGVLYSSGGPGVDVDLVEAHKWFNLAALKGSAAAQRCRGEIASEMSPNEIAEAQKQARAWLALAEPRALAA
jgi:TPR repeat protein